MRAIVEGLGRKETKRRVPTILHKLAMNQVTGQEATAYSFLLFFIENPRLRAKREFALYPAD